LLLSAKLGSNKDDWLSVAPPCILFNFPICCNFDKSRLTVEALLPVRSINSCNVKKSFCDNSAKINSCRFSVIISSPLFNLYYNGSDFILQSLIVKNNQKQSKIIFFNR